MAYSDGDLGWLTDYPPPGSALLPGEVGVYHKEHSDVLLVSYANGLRMSLRAAKRLKCNYEIRARVLDLRWLAPLPFDAIEAHAEECERVLVVDECRATGAGIADAVVADLALRGHRGRLGSVRSADSYVPLGPASSAVLLAEEDILLCWANDARASAETRNLLRRVRAPGVGGPRANPLRRHG